MEPDAWPADMRGYHLRRAARDAYWHQQDCQRAVEGPIVNAVAAVFVAILGFVMVGWWSLVGSPVLVAYCIACRRRSRAARPSAEEAKAKLEALKAQGAKVYL